MYYFPHCFTHHCLFAIISRPASSPWITGSRLPSCSLIIAYRQSPSVLLPTVAYLRCRQLRSSFRLSPYLSFRLTNRPSHTARPKHMMHDRQHSIPLSHPRPISVTARLHACTTLLFFSDSLRANRIRMTESNEAGALKFLLRDAGLVQHPYATRRWAAACRCQGWSSRGANSDQGVLPLRTSENQKPYHS